MARRDRPDMSADREAGRARATAKDDPKEGQNGMTGFEDDQEIWPPSWAQEVFRREREQRRVMTRHPRYAELEEQRVRLKHNEAEMTWSEAQNCVEVLRSIKDNPTKTDAWWTLVAAGKPRSTSHIPGKSSPEGYEWLKRIGLVNDDQLDPHIASVLDASLIVTSNGEMVLTDPVAYTKEFVEEWGSVDSKVRAELDELQTRFDAEEAARRQRDSRGGTGGPVL